ncbi:MULTISPECIES: response regulator [Mycobacterium]|uniref:response regulator n=1 Tax=Mycobacterium TaxID=1763 RepID=UPI001EF04818|nr:MULTISPECIES: response regulator transcription factor [Mycobacterium]
MVKVLVVDVEPHLLRSLRNALAGQGYQVVTADSGAAGLRAAVTHDPAVAVLDFALPDMPGVQMLRKLRRRTTAPVLVLSDRSRPSDKVQALDAGADDYVTKPFDMEEFLARLRAAIRRAKVADAAEQVVETASFTVDLRAKKVSRDGADIHLTPTEWNILELLARNRGRLVQREMLLDAVRGPTHPTGTTYLRVYLAQLRRKLEPDPSHPIHLVTEAGMGYRFEQR